MSILDPGRPAAAVLVAAAATFVASWLGTRAVRRYALAALLDHPNERSSHTVPTPRGGGLALVAAFVAGVAALGAAGTVPGSVALALCGGAAAVAGVGWMDDHGGVPARWRAAVHLLAALWALAWLGGLPVLRLGFADARLGAFGWVVGALGIVWVTNLYNFMDGIDGIAGGQAVSVGIAGAVLLWLAGAPSLAGVSLLLAAASAGFLAWNWPPARIFMGDVGSGALGFLFAALAVASENARALPLVAWVILMGVFVADATVTLARRLARGERVYEAHRSHAYQRAVRGGLTHLRVTASVLGLNAVLALLAAAAWAWPRLLLPALAAAAFLVGGVFLRVERLQPFRGRPERAEAAGGSPGDDLATRRSPR